MAIRLSVWWTFSLATAVFAASLAHAQDKYPAKVIRIVTAPPGSNHDWGARLAAHELTQRINQRVIVENRGSIAVEYVKEATPDGYTVLFYGAVVWLQPLLTKVNWDPLVDFVPITLAMTSPNVLVVVHPALPVRSVRDLIGLAKSRPGQLNYGAGGGGSTPHIAAELFKHMAKVDIVRVNYKGSGPAQIGLLVGEVQVMFAGLGPIMPHVKSGKVRSLAVTTPKRTKLVPDLPAVAEIVSGYASEAAIGFFVPRKTPAAVVSFLNREIVQALKNADQEKVSAAGVEIVAGSPEEFTAFMKAEIARMSEVIKTGSFRN